jgi:exopolyphosphatase
MHLRPENEFVLRHCKVPSEVIIHPDTLPDGLTIQGLITQGVNIALVDQNTLPPGFEGGTVTSIIDHHKDEGLHLDADRLIKPAASCASLVWDRYKSRLEAKGIALSAVPPELADMLLAAIGLDTDNWKEGKATEIDYKSTATLIPLSTFGSRVGDATGDATPVTSTSGIPPALWEFTERLIKEKTNVNGLSNHNLLRRDYKEFETRSGRYGVAVFPRSLKEAAKRESGGLKSFMGGAVDKFMRQRRLDGLCVLTSLSDDSEGKPKRRRETLVVAKSRQDGAIRTSGEAKSLCKHIMDGLYRDERLGMKAWKGSAPDVEALSNGTEGLVGVVAEQGNLEPTRKYVMPLVVSSFESVEVC